MTEAAVDYNLTNEERYWATVYDELMDRYVEMDKIKAMPLSAVRLCVVRYGFDTFLDALLTRGTAWMAERARAEIAHRQLFIAHMVTHYPPDTQEEVDEAVKEMAEDLAAIDCPAGAMRLLLYLDRIRNRELLRRHPVGGVPH